MMLAVRLLAAITALGEIFYLGRFLSVPGSYVEVLAILGTIAWLVSPLLTLALAALADKARRSVKVALVLAAILSAGVPLWLLAPWRQASSSHGGMEPFAIPAIQWLIVFGALLFMRLCVNSARVEATRT